MATERGRGKQDSGGVVCLLIPVRRPIACSRWKEDNETFKGRETFFKLRKTKHWRFLVISTMTNGAGCEYAININALLRLFSLNINSKQKSESNLDAATALIIPLPVLSLEAPMKSRRLDTLSSTYLKSAFSSHAIDFRSPMRYGRFIARPFS